MTGPLQPFPGGAEQAGATAEALAYYERMIQLVDARIGAAQRKVTDFGTVQERDTTGPGATVVFDGDSGAQPVKVPGHVHCFAGDRVVLTRVKGTWVVKGTFNRRQLAEASFRNFGPASPGTTTLGTFVDQPAGVFVNFSKRYDLTATKILLVAPMTATTSAAGVQTGVRVAGTAGTLTASTFSPLDLSVGYHPFVTANLNIHIPVVGTLRTVSLPAGDYTITARWRRATGTGTLTQDSGDLVQLEVDEIFRSTEV